MKLLSADLRHLVFLNYEVSRDELEPFLPKELELDDYEGRHFVSIVALHLSKTKVLGFSSPFHQSFAQINSRFYVRRRVGNEIRRGVVFFRQVVPQRSTALLGGKLIVRGETKFSMHFEEGARDHQGRPYSDAVVGYEWSIERHAGFIRVKTSGLAQPSSFSPQEHFLMQRLWGYHGKKEFRVEHPDWFFWDVTEVEVKASPEIFGLPFLAGSLEKPSVAFLAKGSPAIIHTPKSYRS
jgi:hypothetical protein